MVLSRTFRCGFGVQNCKMTSSASTLSVIEITIFVEEQFSQEHQERLEGFLELVDSDPELDDRLSRFPQHTSVRAGIWYVGRALGHVKMSGTHSYTSPDTLPLYTAKHRASGIQVTPPSPISNVTPPEYHLPGTRVDSTLSTSGKPLTMSMDAGGTNLTHFGNASGSTACWLLNCDTVLYFCT